MEGMRKNPISGGYAGYVKVILKDKIVGMCNVTALFGENWDKILAFQYIKMEQVVSTSSKAVRSQEDDPTTLFSPNEATSGVLCAVLGFSVQEGHGAPGEGPVEGNEDD
ncbi:hypothetical protein BTVI_89951 [Pitangus sulphuratus]|nr:hypothetical protein BTVI_89951 [Pitangus sulphuratus]